MPTDEAMLNEAILAARAGDKTRARDLLTRLLQLDKTVSDHWLWMSAVVETRQEQIYCLQNLLKVDPGNEVARKGLILMGELAVGSKDVRPAVATRKVAWSIDELEMDRPRGWRAVMANPVSRSIVYLVGAVTVLGLITGGFFTYQNFRPAVPTPNFNATAQAIGAITTLTPTSSPVPTATNIFNTPTPTPSRPTPLDLLLDATYTPTPLYVNTPHPQAEAFRLGMIAQTRGNWESMADLMQQTIDLDPTAADAYYYLGIALMNLGEYSQAFNAFAESALADDFFGPAYLGRALARLAMDPTADVSRDFQNAISRAGDFGVIYIERARYLIERGEYDSANDDLEMAASLLPDSAEIPYLRALSAFMQLDYETAAELAADAHERDITHLPTYRLLGEVEFASGNLSEAVEWLETYILYEPSDIEMTSLLARALARAGNLDKALAIFDRLLDENEASPDFYLGRGMTYLAAQNFEAAFRDLNQANRLRRNDYDILLALSIALIETGEPGNAYVTLNQTLELAEDLAQETIVRYYRGRALFDLVSNGDVNSRPAAVRDFEFAIDNAGLLPLDLVEQAQTFLDQLNPSP